MLKIHDDDDEKEEIMSTNDESEEQDMNTAKLVMKTYFRLTDSNGTTAEDIAKYLQEKFGDVWKMTTLTGKAENTLKTCVLLGFLNQKGERYVTNLMRKMKSRRRRRRSSCGKIQRRRTTRR